DLTDTLHLNNDFKLYSVTRKIEAINSLLFYVGNKPFYPNESFFWKSPDEDFLLVGFGAQYKMNYDGTNGQYKKIEELWKKICHTADVNNPNELPGTGPLLFGGFSFDTILNKEDEWKNYADT